MPTPEEPIRITAHPPERRHRRASVVLAQGCCCCCCCCCLHAIGALIGAAVGSALPIEPNPEPLDPDSPFPFRRDEEPTTFIVPTTLLYWALVSVAAGAIWVYYVLVETPNPTQSDMVVGGIVTVLLFPLAQLAASILGFIAVGFMPGSWFVDKGAALWRLGYITTWSFVGCLVGILLMLPLLLL